MKKLLIIAAAMALLGNAVTRAETAPPARRSDHPVAARIHEGLLPPRAGDELALTAEQKAKLAELDKQFQQEREKLGGPSPEHRKLRDKYMDQFRAVLTDEQKQKLDKIREDFRSQRGSGGPRGPRGNKPAPPAEKQN